LLGGQTIFVGRLSYDVSESKLRREFEAYGPVKALRVVHDSVTDKPRGYAFVEFHSQRDMKTAYKSGDGKKLEGRRVVVDVERGRTVPGWQPRRLGGGLGSTRAGGKLANAVVSGRDTGYRAGAPAMMMDEPRAERPRADWERERERAPVPRGDTRPGAEKERPRERERERERDRSPERRRSDHRRRSRSRDRSRGALRAIAPASPRCPSFVRLTRARVSLVRL
jgi:U1 small nuclear ribonucleoprotein